MERVRFSTWDPAEGIEALEEVYAVRGVRRADEGGFSMTHSSAGIGPMTCERLHLKAASSGTTEGTATIRVAHVLGGVLTATSAGDRFPRTGPFLLPQRTFSSWCRQLDLATVALEPTAVTAHARDLLGQEPFRLEFTGIRPVSAAMAQYWVGTINHLRHQVLANEHLMTSPLLSGQALRSVTTALLHTFPSTFLDRAQAPGREPLTGTSGVRRAVAFIEEHLDADIGLPEIAAVARMSPRGLQAAFRREKDTTPTAYLRTARLDAAHQDLLAADPTEGVTVEAVAARWGFAHRGRFAAAYRTRYGHPPATTLRT